MSLRKLCFLAMLATIVAFAGVGRSDVHINDLDPPTPSSPRHNSVLVPEDAAWSRNGKDLGTGMLLVASRNLRDPRFTQTVVLLIQQKQDSVAGLILNQRTDVPLSRAIEGLKGAQDLSDPVYLGGPVDIQTLYALLQSPAKLEGTEHIFGEVYLITSKPRFDETIAARPDPSVLRVYKGYAEWNPDQLRREVERGDWFIFPADAGTVFAADSNALWLRMIQETERPTRLAIR